MKFLTLDGALKRYGSKKGIAQMCKVSPAAVSKAFDDRENNNYKIRIGSGSVDLVKEQPKWKKIKGRA